MTLYIDINNNTNDSISGIGRVTRNIFKQFLTSDYSNDIQFVHLLDQKVLKLNNQAQIAENQSPIEFSKNDTFFFLDYRPEVVFQTAFLDRLKEAGTKIACLIHDVIPLSRWDCFHPIHVNLFKAFFYVAVKYSHTIVCTSLTVRSNVIKWIDKLAIKHDQAIQIGYYYNGCEIQDNIVLEPQSPQLVLNKNQINYLMVGTIEPRKGHAFILKVFDTIWQSDNNSSLIIVGKQGWLTNSLCQQIYCHPEYGEKLIWLEECDDEELYRLYKNCDYLISPSEDEGFGLPVLEARSLGLAVICSDIAVYRELFTDQVTFISPKDSKSWCSILGSIGKPEKKDVLTDTRFTWSNASMQILDILLHNKDCTTINPTDYCYDKEVSFELRKSDIFKQLINKLHCKHLIIYGLNVLGIYLYHQLSRHTDLEVLGFIDAKYGTHHTTYDGIPIHLISDIKKLINDNENVQIIITSFNHKNEMIENVKKYAARMIDVVTL